MEFGNICNIKESLGVIHVIWGKFDIWKEMRNNLEKSLKYYFGTFNVN